MVRPCCNLDRQLRPGVALEQQRGFCFRLLLKFHVMYSQILLQAAKRGVMRNRMTGTDAGQGSR